MKCLPLKAPEAYYPSQLTRAEAYSDFPKQITEELILHRQFPEERRVILAQTLRKQYAHTPGFTGSLTEQNIEALGDSRTFTVTTGQQLHIMLGPLYVLFKITDVIRICRQLRGDFPNYRFVPVFWMASEDHDFAEISTLEFFGKSYRWEASTGGPVGRLSTDSMQFMLEEIANSLHRVEEKQAWQEFCACYKPGISLAEATRNFVHRQFSGDGLVCLDPDDAALKGIFRPVLKKELLEGSYAAAFIEQGVRLAQVGLKPEAHVRNPNLFYINPENSRRSRIDRNHEAAHFLIDDTEWSKDVIAQELDEMPECFSPNVLLRPLYQESILPNLAYIGGPSEYLYWQQTALAFNLAGISRPALLKRTSFVIPDAKTAAVLAQTDVPLAQLWLDENNLRSYLLEHALQDDAFPNLVNAYDALVNQINALLYSWKSPALKELKGLSDNYLKGVQKARKSYEKHMLEHPDQLLEVRRLLKASQRYFSTAHPQERSIHAAAFLLSDTALQEYLTSSFIGEQGSMYLLLDAS
jgi:bacillithiol biosynthesis cysteine-adding enzyme BshC